MSETNEVLAVISQVYSAIQGAQNGATDFAIVRDEKFRNSYYTNVAQAEQNFDRLRSLTSGNPRQQARLDKLEPQIENAFSIFHLVMNQPPRGNFAAALQVQEERSLDEIRRGIQAMEEEEHGLLQQRNAESAASARATISIVVFGNLLALVILIIASGILHHDIGRRLKAERALSSSEQRYRTLFENAPVGLYRTSPDGSILAGNPALIKMLGYSSFDELAQRNLDITGFEPEPLRTQFKERLEKWERSLGWTAGGRKRMEKSFTFGKTPGSSAMIPAKSSTMKAPWKFRKFSLDQYFAMVAGRDMLGEDRKLKPGHGQSILDSLGVLPEDASHY